MKRFVIMAILLHATLRLAACEIHIGVDKNSEKKNYTKGDTVIVNVQVQFTHRVCSEGIKKTKFTCENLKIASATEWKETKQGFYIRRIKAVITNEKNGNAKIYAVRTCDKEGGYFNYELRITN